MKRNAGRLIGRIIVLACIIGTVYLIFSVAATQFVPVKYLVAVSVLLLALVALFSLLVGITKS